RWAVGGARVIEGVARVRRAAAAAVIGEGAQAENGVGAKGDDRVLFGAGRRAPRRNLILEPGVAHHLHGDAVRRLAGDLDVGGLDRAPAEAIGELRALEERIATGGRLHL